MGHGVRDEFDGTCIHFVTTGYLVRLVAHHPGESHYCVVLCCVTCWHVMLCYVMSCHVVSCYFRSRHNISNCTSPPISIHPSIMHAAKSMLILILSAMSHTACHHTLQHHTISILISSILSYLSYFNISSIKFLYLEFTL